eukprot:CAMPEP_0172692340 /NCGR_PEP_ID=MMETSP1074-20121228/25187_1 /TAXON_ID=2916 /ORGANISM="Ceratium fusus, Strain PA161109" /LENGTH=89 /DNA_ID=CAMNT_0013512527 /DNA_START=68 /DNA_END=337 /DNA_ORIENTATION=-
MSDFRCGLAGVLPMRPTTFQPTSCEVRPGFTWGCLSWSTAPSSGRMCRLRWVNKSPRELWTLGTVLALQSVLEDESGWSDKSRAACSFK